MVWLVRLLEELGITNLAPVQLNCDNQSTLHIARNPIFHERTKNIEIICYFTRDKVLEGLLQLNYMLTATQLADVLTKVLFRPHFQDLLSKLGMVNPLDHSSLPGGDKLSAIIAFLTNHIIASTQHAASG